MRLNSSEHIGAVMTDYQDMTGIWRGEYQYDDDGKSVSFTVWFHDMENGLSGNSLEANTFAPGAADELSAKFIGERNGLSFSVGKTYTSELGFENGTLIYDGQVSLDFSTASGRWTYPDFPLAAGTFQLTRLSHKQFVASERRLSVITNVDQ